MQMKRLNLEVIGGLFWTAVGIFFAWGAVKAKLGTFHNPGPGFVPLGIALLLLLFSLFTLGKGLIIPLGQTKEISWRRPAWVVGSVFLYSLLLPLIGFLPATFIQMALLLGLLTNVKRRRWLYVVLFAAAAALGAWLIFVIFLRVPFP
jgi:hypothetical protein